MSIGEDLVAFLLADTAIAAIVGDNVSQNKIPQGPEELPAVWVERSTTDQERTLEANVGTTTQYRESFNVEAVSEDLDEAENLGTLLKALDTAKGSFGSAIVQGVFVDLQTDDYRPKSSGGDEGRNVSALDFEIVGYTEP